MPAKILVVEDNDDARTLWLLVLEAEGYTVITACDGQEGLETAIAEKPDLVLTDISMPRKTGLEMIRDLRARPEFSRLKIIAITAHAHDPERWKGILAQGADRVLSKPVDPFMAGDIVKQLLANSAG